MSALDDVGSSADVALHIQEYLEADLDRVADETVRIDQGLVARTRSLPQVWTLNQLRITSPSSAEEVVALAHLHQGDLPYRHAEALEQLDQYQRRSAAASTERRFGVRDEEGRPVALTKLRSHGNSAWVEDVYTVPTHRGSGNARRLVTHAAALGLQQGHQLVFIIADDDDWPKGLYAEVGFRPVDRGSILHLPSQVLSSR